MVAMIITQVSAMILIGITWPELFENKWNWFAKLVADPPEWLWPVSVLGGAIGFLTTFSPLIGLLAVVIAILGYVKPEWIEMIPGINETNNFFRGPRWWHIVHPPFAVQVALVVVPSLVLGVEIHPLVVVLLGMAIFATTLNPEILDVLGRWNIARWKKMRFIGAVMGLLGFGWAIHSLKFEMLVVLVAVTYVWAKRTGWLDKAKAFVGLA